MRVAVQKLEGVESVSVSLSDGLAEVRLAAVNPVTIARIREVIRSNGFTPKDAEVVVNGVLVEHGGAPALAMEGATPAFRLMDSPQSRGMVSALSEEANARRVEIRGRVPETRRFPAGQLPTLEVGSYVIRAPSSPPRGPGA